MRTDSQVGRARRLTLGIGGLAAVCGLAACGSSASGTPAAHSASPAKATAVGAPAGVQVILDANKRTVAAGAARTSLVEHVRGVGEGTNSLTLEAVTDASRTKVRGMGTSSSEGTLEVLQLGSIEYMRPLTGQFTTILEPGKTWLKLDLGQTASNMGLSQSASTPFAQLMRDLKQADVKVTRLGGDQVRGAPATHYKVATAGDNIATAQMTTVSAGSEVWINQQGLIVQIRQIQTGTVKTSSGPAHSIAVDATITYHDFGVPLPDLTPPPAAQVEDISGILSGSTQSGG